MPAVADTPEGYDHIGKTELTDLPFERALYHYIETRTIGATIAAAGKLSPDDLSALTSDLRTAVEELGQNGELSSHQRMQQAYAEDLLRQALVARLGDEDRAAEVFNRIKDRVDGGLEKDGFTADGAFADLANIEVIIATQTQGIYSALSEASRAGTDEVFKENGFTFDTSFLETTAAQDREKETRLREFITAINGEGIASAFFMKMPTRDYSDAQVKAALEGFLQTASAHDLLADIATPTDIKDGQGGRSWNQLFDEGSADPDYLKFQEFLLYKMFSKSQGAANQILAVTSTVAGVAPGDQSALQPVFDAFAAAVNGGKPMNAETWNEVIKNLPEQVADGAKRFIGKFDNYGNNFAWRVGEYTIGGAMSNMFTYMTDPSQMTNFRVTPEEMKAFGVDESVITWIEEHLDGKHPFPDTGLASDHTAGGGVPGIWFSDLARLMNGIDPHTGKPIALSGQRKGLPVLASNLTLGMGKGPIADQQLRIAAGFIPFSLNAVMNGGDVEAVMDKIRGNTIPRHYANGGQSYLTHVLANSGFSGSLEDILTGKISPTAMLEGDINVAAMYKDGPAWWRHESEVDRMALGGSFIPKHVSGATPGHDERNASAGSTPLAPSVARPQGVRYSPDGDDYEIPRMLQRALNHIPGI